MSTELIGTERGKQALYFLLCYGVGDPLTPLFPCLEVTSPIFTLKMKLTEPSSLSSSCVSMHSCMHLYVNLCECVSVCVSVCVCVKIH